MKLTHQEIQTMIYVIGVATISELEYIGVHTPKYTTPPPKWIRIIKKTEAGIERMRLLEEKLRGELRSRP